MFARAVFSLCLSGISLQASRRGLLRITTGHPSLGGSPATRRSWRELGGSSSRPRPEGFSQKEKCFTSASSGFKLWLVLRLLQAHREMSWDKVFAAADSDKRLAGNSRES